MKRIGLTVAAILLAVTMAFSPIGMAMAEARSGGQPIMPTPMPIPIDPIAEEVPLSIEVIENTRELVKVRVNDVLITQVIDDRYSTKDTTVAVLRIEDLITNTVEEMRISVRYEAGQYKTTLFSEGIKIGTFSTGYDPLEPGVLPNVEHRNIRDIEDISQVEIQSQLVTRRWDGVTYVCGRNIDIHFSRPCVVTHRVCTFRTMRIRGTRMNHWQISEHWSRIIVGLPPVVSFAVIGTLIGGLKGAAIGAAAALLTGVALCYTLRDERGNVWVIAHRSIRLVRVPIFPWWIIAPRLFRAGGSTLWDACSRTRRNP